MHGKPIDPKFQRLMEFAKNFKLKTHHPSISNLYVMQTVDRDGNVVEERYGMNLMTNYGMSQYFVNRANFPTNLYIGNGSGTFNHTTNSLLSPIITTAATVSNSSKSYQYPLYYDSHEGIITTVMKYMEVYFDYNPAGISGPIDISEYGIGSAYNQLWTHSWVYNNIGAKSTIRKDINTRLYITVYMCMSYNESLINNALAEGKYICITGQKRFFNKDAVTMQEDALYTFRRYDYYSRTKSHTSGYQNNIVSISSNMSDFILQKIETANTSQNGYIDGFVSWNPMFNMFERVTLDTPDPFDIVGFPLTNQFDKVDGFSYSFGDTATAKIPFTTFTLSGSYTFNYKTGLYTCGDHYVYDPLKWYDESSFKTDFATTLYFTNNNEIAEIKLYRNMQTDDPIVSIESAMTNLYATDRYWDTSSWVRIEDMSSIPAAQQTKKFWLSVDNVSIVPKRSRQSFEFIASDDTTHAPTLNFQPSDFIQGDAFTTCDKSSSLKWFVIGTRIYIVSRGNLIADVPSSGYNISFGYNNIVIHHQNQGSSTSFYTTNITDTTPTPTLTSTLGDIQPGHSRISESFNGYAIMAYSNSVLKLDMTGSSLVQTQLANAVDAACICRSNNYAYIDATNTRRIYIKKLSDDTLVKQIDIRSDYAVPTFVFGFKNYLYILAFGSYIYMYNITTDTLTELPSTSIPTGSGWNSGSKWNLATVCTENCLVLYSRGHGSHGVICVTYSNPTVVKTITNLLSIGYYESGCSIDIAEINGDSLLLRYHFASTSSSAWGRACIRAFDLGHYMYDETIVTTVSKGENYTYPVVFFGEFGISHNVAFPLANMMPHRLVGTTTCVTTCKQMKHITDKRWTLEVTNLGGFTGIPPGTRQ